MASDEELAQYIYNVYINKAYDHRMLYSTGIWVKGDSGITYRRGSKIVMWVKGERVEIEISDHRDYYCETANFRIGDDFHIYRHPLAWKIWKDYYNPPERQWKTHDELKDDIAKKWF